MAVWVPFIAELESEKAFLYFLLLLGDMHAANGTEIVLFCFFAFL